MARKNLIRQSKFPYHITTRCNNKEWFRIPMEKVWKLFLESLYYARENRPVEVHAFVLMDNHYHLLVTTPESDIDKFMFFLNKRFSDLINRETGAINHKFSNRYHWSIVNSKRYLYTVTKYIFNNPVRANIVEKPQNYIFSSLYYTTIRLTLRHFINNPFDECWDELLTWINEQNANEDDELIRKGLKKTIFVLNAQKSKVFRASVAQSFVKR